MQRDWRLISKQQVRLLKKLCNNGWVYISKLPPKDRLPLLSMENKGLIQVKGRDKYDFALWGQLRVTSSGKEYLRCLKSPKKSRKEIKDRFVVPKSRKFRKSPRIDPRNRKYSIDERRMTKIFEARQKACLIERRNKAEMHVVEDFGLTLDEVLRIEDPEIRRKLLIQWRSHQTKLEAEYSLAEDELEQDIYEIEVLGEYRGDVM